MIFNCLDLNIYLNNFNIDIGLACLKVIHLIYSHIYHISRISKQNAIHFRIGVLTMIIIIPLFIFLVHIT